MIAEGQVAVRFKSGKGEAFDPNTYKQDHVLPLELELDCICSYINYTCRTTASLLVLSFQILPVIFIISLSKSNFRSSVLFFLPEKVCELAYLFIADYSY